MSDDKKNYLSILDKYHALQIENDKLKIEDKKLKDQLSLLADKAQHEASTPVIIDGDVEKTVDQNAQPESLLSVNQNSSPTLKIKLFMSLFKGREDVYAKRWQNKAGVSGYSPVCANEWKTGVCNKPKIKCSECSNKAFENINENVIEEHLKGNITTGIYPLLLDETCYFLAIDFDDEDWEKDVSVLRNICNEFEIPLTAERSRSGNGAHVWFFFEDRIPASLARKFGSSLLTYAMSKRHEIKFKSYDRFFPNQDTMPKGGFGNLIALPLQMKARKKSNSIFIDEKFKPYPDQWKFLSSVNKLTGDTVIKFISELNIVNNVNDLGILRKNDDENSKPWEIVPKIPLTKIYFPEIVYIENRRFNFFPYF